MKLKRQIDPETGSQTFEYWDKGEILGTAQGSVDGGELEVESIWVRPDSRRRGVGSALLKDLISHAQDKGAEGVQLEFHPEPQSDAEGAKRFYKNFGLKEGKDGFFRGSLKER